MTNYRFCYLDGAGRIVNREERECVGELGALEYARALSPYQAIEIWDGTYRVAHIRKGDDPLEIRCRPSRWNWVLAES